MSKSISAQAYREMMGVSTEIPQASAKQQARGLAPHDRASMNKTERRYAEHLEQERLAGRIIKWRFQSINFRLADRTHHCPDFLVMLNGGWQEIHEIKGWNKKRAAPVWTEVGWMRFKMGREHFDEYHWRLICLIDGEWKEWLVGNGARKEAA